MLLLLSVPVLLPPPALNVACLLRSSPVVLVPDDAMQSFAVATSGCVLREDGVVSGLMGAGGAVACRVRTRLGILDSGYALAGDGVSASVSAL